MTPDSKQQARATAKIHATELLRLLKANPDPAAVSKPVYECEQLERAIEAFHMEAIRFRMYSLERFVHHERSVAGPEAQRAFSNLKAALEAAGFQTR